MKFTFLLIFFAFEMTFTGCSQTNEKKQEGNLPRIGGECEGCEAVYESHVPFEHLTPVDTLPDFNEAGPKIEVSGVIYQPDGRTPAKNVVVYIYHTNQQGIYPAGDNEKGWGKRHGYIRGWMKTDQKGFYKFYTLVPASYPDGRNPKHIHSVVKEDNKNEYWIDDFLFEDDPYLPKEERNRPSPRGGNGILTTAAKEGMLRATRNIILGLNVPGYPGAKK